MPRGQVPMPMLEAAIGVLLLTSFALVLATGVPDAAPEQRQLDAYARDVGQLLEHEPPRHRNQTRLAEVTASPDTFERERDALERRIDRLLPANLFYRVHTDHGAVGYAQPDGIPVGTTTVPTVNGPVTIEVWYG